MKKIPTPKLDARKLSDLESLLAKRAVHYTPEWQATDEKDSGTALLKIFSYMAETVIHRFNRVPNKSLIAFLDMIGIKLLPARSSRVPLTFKLAKGTQKSIVVPVRTQAAAGKSETHDELPFETEKTLLAIPSAIKKVVTVDPKADTVYLPPASFPIAESIPKTRLKYKMLSSASKGSQILQLDHVSELKKGDFLKIEGKKGDEYDVITAVSGNIVTLADALLHTYPVDTEVEKITDFLLFKGKNMQEHSLYIGHRELFNIKSRAQFILSITHAGAQADTKPLNVSWEYWGEAEGTEGEHWRKFAVTDSTGGLSSDGEITLLKSLAGEMKEREINGIKSRWIRCRLDEPLIADTTRKLPLLDNILFRVRSAGQKLLPDLAFSNETPLDVSKPFTPFGKEPRIFDGFSIASKEAFSKKGAKVTLDFEIDSNLGAPCAIEHGKEILLFARGPGGRLVEIETKSGGGNETWRDHGVLPGTKIAFSAQPAAISPKGENLPEISVFVRTENGHLVERSIERVYNGTPWKWLDHGVPATNIKTASDPAVIYDASEISVFVIGSDGKLYEFYRASSDESGEWIDHGHPGNVLFRFSPAAIKDEANTGKSIVFTIGDDGRLYELQSRMGINKGDVWKEDFGSPPSVTLESRPLVSPYKVSNVTEARIFANGSDGNLWEIDSNRNGWKSSKPEWMNLGRPDGALIDSPPHGFLENAKLNENPYIFVKGSDSALWELTDIRTGSWVWVCRRAPAKTRLLFSPFALDTSETMYVFFAGSDQTIVAWNPTERWKEYKDPNATTPTPSLSWEYWNKKGWVILKGLEDGTQNLIESGTVTFVLPDKIAETEVAGQKNYWIRARIVGGDYGKEMFAVAQPKKLRVYTSITTGMQAALQLISSKSSVRPPLVNRLTISYSLETEQLPRQTVAFNNLGFLNHTEASRTHGKYFAPFVPLQESEKTIYLGFERYFKGGPVRIFFAAKELAFSGEKKPKLQWSCSRGRMWSELSYLDATEGLIKADILDLALPGDFSARSIFGHYLYWIKGSMVQGEYETSPLLKGIYHNTAWAIQAGSVKDEILGSSDAGPDQTLSFRHIPVLEGEEIRVREILSQEEKERIAQAAEERALFEIKNEESKVTETWVLWQEVPDFFDSGPDSRHYTLDRATGELRFGDGVNGKIPPAGDDNIKAFFYQSGGGLDGNVAAEEIETLKSSVGGVKEVFNPVAADGGADTASVDQMLKIGPAMISHRNRAVSAEDFEWLAKEASRKVARAKCLQGTDRRNTKERGRVTIIIVPDSPEVKKPIPSLELKRSVRRYLESRCFTALARMGYIDIKGPLYVEVGVKAEIYVTSIDMATKTERRVRRMLDAFLHPLTGGPEGEGWLFGRGVNASDLYAMLESLEGVDHVKNLQLCGDGKIFADRIEVEQDVMVACGRHWLEIKIAKGG